ncbi:cell filamentation protein Fic, partial [Bacillus cereus]|nr:cell filamentation protein Fic [Bacillus cereus]
MTVLENKLGIKNQLELNRVEERLSKMKAKDLYDSGEINHIE